MSTHDDTVHPRQVLGEVHPEQVLSEVHPEQIQSDAVDAEEDQPAHPHD
jgi:hypothetical protein